MFFRDLKPKPNVTLQVALADVHLPVKLGHRDAGKIFGEPLQAQLAAAGMGTVLDCRTRTRASGAINGVDLYLGLTDTRQSALKTVAGMLEYLAAPCGSSIRLSEGLAEPLIFGATEGLELSVGTVEAPDAETRRDLALACKDAIQHLGVSRGWALAQDRTLFYFYGESFAEMREGLASILNRNPRFSSAAIRRMA
ncbi:MAG: hypothetical protein HKN18_13605 [Silicimonas sp.]|nr:hypothetical protein [Silicimonas sp.]